MNYFRSSDFNRIFNQVDDYRRVFGGQYLYVILELSSMKKPVYDLRDRVVFLMILQMHWSGIEVEVRQSFGGSSKGVIFSLLRSRIRDSIDLVIDINPTSKGNILQGQY